jgi:hypothetical protein
MKFINRPQSSNVYRKFNLTETSDNSNEIFKLIKRLCVNNKDYNSYKHEYIQTTQDITFKKPEIESYPIIKNDQYIPINRRIKSGYNNKNRNLRLNYFNKSNITNTNNDSENQEIKNINNKINLSNLLITNNNNKNNKTFSRPKSAFNTINLNKFNLQKPSLKGQEKINILRDILFYDQSYLNLNYDESEIFYKINYYNEFVHNKILFFQKEKNKNLTSFLKKDYFNYEPIGNFNSNFYKSKENEMKINMTLKSMKIEFVNLTNKNKKNIIFNIPFSILPIFYYKNLDNLKFLLIACFNFNEEFDKIEFDDEGIYHLLDVCPEFSYKVTKKNNNNENENFIKKTDSKKEKNFIEKVKTHKHPKQEKYKIENIKEIKNISNYLNQYDIYKFIWITPKNNFKVIIRLPEVTVNINKIFISKFVNIELIFFLLKRNFLSWDFYLIHYLFSFKAFRWIIEKTFSNNIKNMNLEKFYNENNVGFINFKRVTNNDNNIILYLNLSKERIMKITKSSFSYLFFYTSDDNKNGFKILHSFDFEVSNPNVSENKFYFKFNFNQMLQINDISKIQNVYFFFNKLLINDKQNMKIKFNYLFFDHYEPGKTYLNTFKPQPIIVQEETKEPLYFSGNIINNSNYNSNNNKMSNLDKVFFELLEREGFETERNMNFYTKVTFPFLEKLEYDRKAHFLGDTIMVGNVTINNNGKNVSSISVDILDKLNNLTVEEWPEILIKNVKDNVAADFKRKTKRKLTKKGTMVKLNKKVSVAYNVNPSSSKAFFNKRNTIMFKQ